MNRHKHWHEGPPGWGDRPWPPPEWREHRDKRRGCRLFLGFVLSFGTFLLLMLGAMAALAALLARAFGGGAPVAALTWVGGIALVVGLPLLALTVARSAARRITMPLSDLMQAADALAAGDLSVRVPVHHGHGDFTRFADSFNHMAEQLEHADRLRRDMAADVAHELRTPLHIIQGNLEGILDGVYAPTLDHVQATLDETRALGRLVEDLRTLSLAEAGQLPLECGPVDVRELLADAATSFSGQAEVAGVALHVDAPADPQVADEPLTVDADAGRLDQVLTNLLANALRYTPRGGQITLSAERVATTERDAVRIRVADDGEGIATADLPHVFERYWKRDPSRLDAAYAGSGLGLAIARRLVEAHGGRIEVTSAPGEGTIFTIELSAKA
jgi:signal transduction histidine kinase